MRFRVFGAVALALFAAAAAPAARTETALDRYVAAPDSSYKWEVVKTNPAGESTTFVVSMTSQTWRDKSEVNHPVWQHWLTIVKPSKVKSSTGFLFITGGNRDAQAPEKLEDSFVQMALATGSVVAELRGVPNEPLTFTGETKSRTEDGIIAYTWDKYLRGGDDRWPLRLPMTKAAVRAMDTVTALLKSDQGGGVLVDRFVVAGGSKRGWTTWTTAVVDKRVVAIVPFVIDLLNIEKSFEHHYRVYGFFAPAVKDYEDMRLMDWDGIPRYRELMKIVEPYQYRDRLTMPKFLVNATGDQFFLPDSSQFYFDDLPGEKHLRYVPNTDHGMSKSDARESLHAFYEMLLQGKPRPKYSWRFEPDGSILWRSATKPTSLKLWQATNPRARDFRLMTIGPAWTSTTLEPAKDGSWTGRVEKPATGFTAYFVEATYPTGGKYPLKLTSGVRVAPDIEPHPAYRPQPPVAETALEGFDAFVETVLQDWKVPGASVAIVRDNKVVLAKGYGYRDVARKQPATGKTLFAIGSITKSFTVTALGMLSDEGKLDWNKHVRDYLPDFELSDRTASDFMTPMDLVTHRSGLPRHDLVWYGSPATRDQLYKSLKYLELSKEFRSTWQYNNLLLMTAGIMGAKIAGTSWEDLIRERIFKPLGMTGSNFSVNDSQKSPDYALPYGERKDEVQLIPFRNIDAIGPAGSINSNAEDMARYVLLHLNEGMVGAKQLVSKNHLMLMHSPEMVTPPAPLRYKEPGYSSYGMGIGVASYRGYKDVTHGGGIDGFSALLSFLPQARIGVVVLTNLSGTPATSIITNNVFDRLLGLDQIEWSQRFLDERKRNRAAAEEAKKKQVSSRKEGTKPSHPLKDYAGDFEHPAYGRLAIATDGDHLKASLHGMDLAVEHFHYDIFEATSNLDPDQKIKLEFLTNAGGDIDRVQSPLESGVKPIVFTRAAPKKALSRAALQAYIGSYKIGNRTLEVGLDGGVLSLRVPGQPIYELAPATETVFQLKGLEGFRVEFKKDASGAVTGLISHQPNGSFAAERQK